MLLKCHGCFKHFPNMLSYQLRDEVIKIGNLNYITILQERDNGIISPLMCTSCYQKAIHIEWTTSLEKSKLYNVLANNIMKDPRALIEKFYKNNEYKLVCI